MGNLVTVPSGRLPDNVSWNEWVERDYHTATFCAQLVEDAPNSVRNFNEHGNATVLHMHFNGLGWTHVFAHCHSCRNRNFHRADQAFPLTSNITEPSLPRVGKCGCVCCNGCVLANEANDRWIKCPACNEEEAHHHDYPVWIVTPAMLEKAVNVNGGPGRPRNVGAPLPLP